MVESQLVIRAQLQIYVTTSSDVKNLNNSSSLLSHAPGFWSRSASWEKPPTIPTFRLRVSHLTWPVLVCHTTIVTSPTIDRSNLIRHRVLIAGRRGIDRARTGGTKLRRVGGVKGRVSC